jgi:hypothetical protein
MTEADYAALITAAHCYLDAPVIVIWDYVARNIMPQQNQRRRLPSG